MISSPQLGSGHTRSHNPSPAATMAAAAPAPAAPTKVTSLWGAIQHERQHNFDKDGEPISTLDAFRKAEDLKPKALGDHFNSGDLIRAAGAEATTSFGKAFQPFDAKLYNTFLAEDGNEIDVVIKAIWAKYQTLQKIAKALRWWCKQDNKVTEHLDAILRFDERHGGAQAPHIKGMIESYDTNKAKAQSILALWSKNPSTDEDVDHFVKRRAAIEEFVDEQLEIQAATVKAVHVRKHKTQKRRRLAKLFAEGHITYDDFLAAVQSCNCKC